MKKAHFSAEERLHWEHLLEKKIASTDLGDDPAHDLAHFRRVTATARKLCEEEGACWEIVMPAAWLHDLINVPKNDPRRSQASRLSGEAAIRWLSEQGYPEQFHSDIAHAIEAHSFSAKIEPRTLEARIVQDADRLDGLGAIGVARCFAVAGLLRRRLYHPDQPLPKDGPDARPLNDLEFTVDHFYVKLFKTAETLRTPSGRAEGQRRAEFMRQFLNELSREIGSSTELA